MENNAIVLAPPVNRRRIPNLLTKRFMADYHESIKELPLNQKIELSDHLLWTTEFLQAFNESRNEDVYWEYVKKEESLLRKFGRALKSYKQSCFYKYFDLNLVLAEKDILTCEEFNGISSCDEHRPSKEEMKLFINSIKKLLYFERDFLLLERDPEFELDQKSPVQNGINWTGCRDGKNDFVQMIYGLHRAGLINSGKGEITKIIETLAPAFNVELGKNWQSNHSASIHKVNRDYQPPVFDKVKEAYLKYAEGLIQDKKNKQ